MASLDGTIIFTSSENRPCIVSGKDKAIFHRWSDHAEEAYEGGNVIKWTTAIVEYEDGQVAEVMPCEIKFLDVAQNEKEAAVGV